MVQHPCWLTGARFLISGIVQKNTYIGRQHGSRERIQLMRRRKRFKLTIVSVVMLLIFAGYTIKTAWIGGESPRTAIAEEVHGPDATTQVPQVGTAAITGGQTGLPGTGSSAAVKPGKDDSAPKPATPKETAKPNEAVKPTGPVKKPEGKQIALTFDDGPDKTYTPQVLDILKKHDVKATFFVVGIQIAKYGDVLKRIQKEGHAIGNHSYNHAKLTERTPKQIAEEIAKTDEALRKVLGSGTDLFRAPYGATNEQVKSTVASAKQELIHWTVDTKDWAGTPPEQIMEIVKEHAKPGGIILMHSFGGKNGKLDNTVEVLPQMIEYLKQKGYTFVTVPELLAGKAA